MSPDHDAAELPRLDELIAIQREQAVAAHQAWVTADMALRATIARRDGIVAKLRATSSAAPPGPPVLPTPSTVVPQATPASAGPEASTRTVQNILFILGGLLLGTAAVVFTAVAWTTFGIRGRAAILGVVTVLALAAPILALVRRLRATAETFAAIALLLVLLDGYAAWSVNLLRVQSLPDARYAGLVAVTVALIGLAYGCLSSLIGPRFVALLAVQPVLPLLFAPEPLTLAGWSAVCRS